MRINGKCVNASVTSEISEMEPRQINLDVTAMMAYCSSLTCESNNWKFKGPILTDQAKREKIASTKTFLLQIFHGKHLIACKSAVKSFLNILHTVGGPNEIIRGENLLKMITIYPDLNDIQENTLWSGNKLCIVKKIQERTRKILTFGVYHKALTVTANKSAVIAAEIQV